MDIHVEQQLPVVVQALSRWDSPYASTSLQLAKQLAAERLVFYVDHPFSWKEVHLHKNNYQLKQRQKVWSADTPCFQQPYHELPNFINVCPRPVMPINWLNEGRLYQYLRQRVNASLWADIDQVLSTFEVEEFIYMNSFDPVFFSSLTSKTPRLSLYHCVDHMAGERYIARHGVQAEIEAARQADAVICTSRALQQKMQAYQKQVYCIPNAADFQLFSQPVTHIPEDMAAIEGPKVLYTGNIGLRIDYELLEQAASRRPDLQFVFIGPIDNREFKGHQLFTMPNTHFLGARPVEALPAYLKAAQVCMIPFLCNELTRYIYPLKINEYLAAGKAVVLSGFADLSEFEGQLYEYESAEDFLNLIHKAMQEDSAEAQQQRIRMASQNTWSNRLDQFNKIISKLLNHKYIRHELEEMA